MSLFQNKYRIESTRLQNWDYSLPGIYFITICTDHRFPWFGKVKNDKWQARFYDRIITNKRQFINTKNYILKNPENLKK